MKIVGYGICGNGESKRYMKATLDEFKRLCDITIILGNSISHSEKKLIAQYGFKFVEDNREWGKFQWKIKQDFLQNEVARYASEGDMMVCLDMDEVLSKECTREWLLSAPLDAYYVYVVDLWNDPEHYKPESCFWNVRLFRWRQGENTFKQKPVHCGLAPEWAYFYHRHAPFLLKHYGLMKKEDRDRRIERYKKYDPEAKHLSRTYYDMLSSDKAKPFDEASLYEEVKKEVASYKQTKPKTMTTQTVKPRFAYIRNPHGLLLDIPERDLAATLKRKGFEFLGWAGEETNGDKVVDVIPAQSNPLKCALCPFVAKTATALKAHKTKKHK